MIKIRQEMERKRLEIKIERLQAELQKHKALLDNLENKDNPYLQEKIDPRRRNSKLQVGA